MASYSSVAGIALTFVLAGFVKGTIGLGLPTVAMGLLGLAMPPSHAAALLIVPSFVTNVWQLASGASIRPLLRRLAPMMTGVCAGTWASLRLMTSDTDASAAATASAALGLALAAYALVGLLARPWSIPRRWEPWLSPLVGLATGLVTGATGVFVMPAVPYLQALGFEKEDLMQALGLSFTVSTVALAIGLGHAGTLDVATAGASLLALAPALAGMSLGTWLRQRVSAPRFRRWFLVSLFALGAHLWWRA